MDLLGHEPPCETWQAHVARVYASLPDDFDYRLEVLLDLILHTWENELLAADPEYVPGGRAA